MTAPGRVAVVGSLHYDIAVWSAARPRKGETVAGQSWRPKLGGKGRNQAAAAARAGASVGMVGAVGDDQFGRDLLADLDARGIDRRFVRVAPGTGSGMSVAIFDADGDYGAVIVSGANLSLSVTDIAAARQVLQPASVLLLQNEVPEAANIAAAAAVHAAGGVVVLNAAPARQLSGELAPLVDLLVVNAIEASMLGRFPEPRSLEDAAAAARQLAPAFGAVIVTAGAEGVGYSGPEGQLGIAGELTAVASTHGAGDEFVGHLAASLARGTPIEEALRQANRAAARLVGTPEALRG